MQIKKPALAISDSDDENETLDQQAILEQLSALERAQVLSLGSPLVTREAACGQNTRQASQKIFKAEILKYLSGFF